MRKKLTSKRIAARGRHITLPIVGDIVSELWIGIRHLPTLIFQDPINGESQIEFEEAITLMRGDVEFYLTGSRPGATYDPKQLAPLLELIGAEVVDAWAHHDGPLEITFDNGWMLRVIPESDYEAWNFQYPRPGRPPSGNIEHFVSAHGAGGRLI